MMNILTLQTSPLPAKILFVLSLCILGCDGSNRQQIDREAIKKEMSQREITHILPAEIVEAAYAQGKDIAAQAQEIAVNTFKDKIGSDSENDKFLADQTLDKIDSLGQVHEASIRWIAVDEDDTESLSDLERQLWEAYLYNIENKLPVNDNVQKIDDKDAYLYTQPVMLNSILQTVLSDSMPLSGEHDFMGMWSIELSRKNIILNDTNRK